MIGLNDESYGAEHVLLMAIPSSIGLKVKLTKVTIHEAG